MSAVDISALATYGGTYEKSLITRILNGMEVANHVTVLPGLKNKHNFTKLKVGNIVKPFTSTHAPTANALQYTGRSIEVQIGKADLLIDTNKYRPTWQGEFMKPGVNPNDLPFEKYVWQAVTDEFGSEINDSTAYLGSYNSAGSNAAAVATGFGTLIAAEITAETLVPITTGALTSSNAVAAFEKVYKGLPVAYRKKKVVMYCSYNSFDAYCEDYGTKFGTQPIYNQFQQMTIRHSAGNCVIQPASWMGTSGRLICTPKENMIMGTDLLSDVNKINSVPDVWTLKVGIAMAVAFQIRDLEALAVNEQA